MNASDYINQFWELDKEHHFNHHETWLYFYLLGQWYESGEAETFIPKLLPKLLPKMLLKRSRDTLVKIGLIAYHKGDRRLTSASYGIRIFTNDVTNIVTNDVTNQKEKVSPTPPLKENNLEREKERITKVIPKKEEDLAFCLPSFVPIMEMWLEYKKERKQAYKPKGIRTCYNHLLKLSDNNPTIARMIVEQSIANNYQGLFELRNNGVNKANYSEKRAVNEEVFRQFVADREQRASGMAYEVEKPF